MNQVMQLTVFGLHIVECRWRLGLTQQALADRLEWKRPYLSRIEHGKTYINYETMMKIAEALGTEVWKLVKPWPHTDKHIERIKAIIKKYHGKLPPSVRKRMERKG